MTPSANGRPLQRSEQRSEMRMPQRRVVRNALNRFDVDERKIPPNMSYGWKRKTLYGMEDIEGLINAEANGWTCVPPDRHPELMGSRASQANEIVRGGLVLMERPKEMTNYVMDLEERDARRQIANQMQRLQIGGHRAAGRGVKTNYEPAPQDRQVPEDAV